MAKKIHAFSKEGTDMLLKAMENGGMIERANDKLAEGYRAQEET